jgi:membrane protein YqaA with SNARE-associated domain
MIARYTGGILGTLAFSVSVLVGLWTGNPVLTILSRAIWALVLFCVIGLLLGAVAQYVIDDYARRRYQEVVPEAEEAADSAVGVTAEPVGNARSTSSSTEVRTSPMGT